LQRSHQNLVKAQGPGITGIGTTPKFAIGQRALLVQTAEGNLLWDCISVSCSQQGCPVHFLPNAKKANRSISVEGNVPSVVEIEVVLNFI